MFLDKTPGRTCFADGKEYLFFSGYAYLGMNYVEGFIKNIKEGINKYGILFPSSRNSNTKLPLFGKMEDRLSQLTSTEDSVIFSSGYLAGQTIAAILSQHTNIFIAPGTHPSILIPESNMPEESFKEWIDKAIMQINNSNESEFVLIADSVNILESIVHDFSFVTTLPTDKKIIFLIDDSHGLGILGEKGEGIVSTLPGQKNVDYIVSYSLSKAFNIEGGAVSGSSKWCNLLRAHPNYTGSTSISPALVYAFLQSTELYSSQKHRLEENINEFINCTNHPAKGQQLPIFLCKNEDAADIFLKNEVIISSFPYPFPGSKIANRIIINALHLKEDIHQLSGIWNLL